MEIDRTSDEGVADRLKDAVVETPIGDLSPYLDYDWIYVDEEGRLFWDKEHDGVIERTYPSWIKMRTERHRIEPEKKREPTERDFKIARLLELYLKQHNVNPFNDMERDIVLGALTALSEQVNMGQTGWAMLQQLWSCGLLIKKGFTKYGRARNTAWKLVNTQPRR